MTPEEIASKYIEAPDGLIISKKMADMAKDIRDYARKEAEDFALFGIKEFLTPLIPAFKMTDDEMWDRFMESKIKK